MYAGTYVNKILEDTEKEDYNFWKCILWEFSSAF